MRPYRQLLLVLALIISSTIPAMSSDNEWTGSGPFATNQGNRIIKKLTVASDGVILAGTGSGTVFSLTTTLHATCGTSNGKSFPIAPTTGLCNSGTPDQVPAGSGPWSWVCKGLNGGHNVSCSASLQVTAPVQTGSNVAVTPTPAVKLNFSNVSSPGTVQVKSTNGPGISITVGSIDYTIVPGTSYDIASTAATSGLITVCISYNPAKISVSENILRLLRSNGTSWDDITTSVDTVNDQVCGQTTILSSFVIGYRNILKSGDCNGDGSVTIDEVQSAINMYLGLKTPATCVDINGDGVTIDEVQKVINGYLGL
ncbi:MAG: hypothetical protein WCP20_22885 [Desulfuromonadales bacterium]